MMDVAGFFFDFERVSGGVIDTCHTQVVLAPHNTLSDLDAVKEKYGHYGIPVTIDGRLHSKLVGIVTKRDVDFQEDRSVRARRPVVFSEGRGVSSPSDEAVGGFFFEFEPFRTASGADDAPRRPRRGPKRLKFQKETTHELLSWRRRASTA